jgi:hypothetical protein
MSTLQLYKEHDLLEYQIEADPETPAIERFSVMSCEAIR